MRGNLSQYVIFSFLFTSAALGLGQTPGDSETKTQVKPCERPLTRRDSIVHQDPYRWLEQNSPERRAWISEQQTATLQKVRSSPTYSPLQDLLWRLNNAPQDMMVKPLAGGFEVALLDRGLRQPREIVLRSGGKEVAVLFSTKKVAQDGSVNLTKFYMDPAKQRIVVPVTRNGSLDIADLYVVNIESGDVEEVIRETGDYGITWLSDSEFQYQKYIDRDGSSFVHKLGDKRGDRLTDTRRSEVQNDPHNRYLITTREKTSSIRSVDGTLTTKIQFPIQSVVGENDKFLFVTRQAEGGWTEVVQIEKKLSPTGQMAFGAQQVIEPTQKGRFCNAFANNDKTLLTFRLGARYWGVFLDGRGRIEREIDLPSCCDIKGFKVTSPTTADVTLASPIHLKKMFQMDLTTLQFKANVEEAMLTDDQGTRYTEKIVEGTSKDGKKFPIRLTFRSDLKIDGEIPSLVEGYGGFGAAGYFDPFYNPMNYYFLRSGGMHVAPILRGGPELGPEFRNDAKFQGKQKTFDDMIATLETITTLGYTKPQKIAAMGWSNGGLLIGALVTQRPELLRVAIPGNGVQDMLRKEILDPRFANGWEYEYGSPDDPKLFEVLSKYSPVHNAKPRADYPTILIVTGLEDSRVNNAHSFKLAAALQEAQQGPAPVMLFSVPQAGHWASKPALQDLRAVDTLLAIWSTIYDELGLKLKN